MDPIQNINFETDSTLPIIFESQKRKNQNYIFEPNSLSFKKNSVYALVKEIKFNNKKLNNYTLSNSLQLNLNALNYIFIRQDPPYNMEYITSMHLLEHMSMKGQLHCLI